MHRQALKLCQRVLSKEHPSTLTSMNNLALVLSKYEQGEEMHRQTLGLETVLSKYHLSTLTSMDNPGYVLRDQDKYEEVASTSTQAAAAAAAA